MGYPSEPDQSQLAQFDAEASVVLFRQLRLNSVEAAKGGGWEFLSCVLMPDLVRWRFAGPATAQERFLSGRRNVFQRLWWRAAVLSGDAEASPEPLLELLKALGEDELVQLMERPSIAGIEGLSRSIAKSFLRIALTNGTLARRLLIRKAKSASCG